MKILSLTDNFPPEYNAPATRTYEHCKEWVRLGADVTVITCFPNFPRGKIFDGYKNKWKEVEIIDGIRVIRVWSFISANQGTFKRTLDFLSFAATSLLAGLRVRCDIIIATSPQFFTAVSGGTLSFIKRKPWVMEVRDIWPESIKAVGAVKSPWVLAQLEKLELFLYRRAQKIIVVTDSFKINLVLRGVHPDKIFVVKNGVDLSLFQPLQKNVQLIQKLQLERKFVVGYVGTHGLAHSLDFIVQSISKINDLTYHFLFIGDGAEKNRIMQLSANLNLRNITFIDPVKKSEIDQYLALLDVALVPLRRSSTFESVIPSKIFETAAMNVPILLGVNGESRAIIEQYNAGIYFEPENEDDFIAKLHSIREKIQSANIFIAGCRKMADDFDRRKLARQMLDTLSL